MKDESGSHKCPCGGVPHRTPSMIRQRRYVCAACLKKKLAEWRAANTEKLRAYRVAHREQNPDMYVGHQKARRAREKVAGIVRFIEPAKKKARQAVNNAVNRGKMKRFPCEKCARSPAQAHHEDYAKPLDVRWLCASCHGLEHWKEKRNA